MVSAGGEWPSKRRRHGAKDFALCFSLWLSLSLLIVGSGHAAQQATAGRDAAAALLQSGQLVSALEAAKAEPDPLLRELAVAEVYFQARDFPACLQACEAALQLDSNHLLTLWVAARAALWLQDGTQAQEYAQRLRAAAHVDLKLSRESQADWIAAAEDYISQAEGWLQKNTQRDSALIRSKATTSAFALLLVGAFFLLLRKSKARELTNFRGFFPAD